MAPKTEKQGGKTKYTSKELSTLTKVLNENFHFDTPKGIINAKSKKTLGIKYEKTGKELLVETAICLINKGTVTNVPKKN